jgi:hypothetical protein
MNKPVEWEDVLLGIRHHLDDGTAATRCCPHGQVHDQNAVVITGANTTALVLYLLLAVAARPSGVILYV